MHPACGCIYNQGNSQQHRRVIRHVPAQQWSEWSSSAARIACNRYLEKWGSLQQCLGVSPDLVFSYLLLRVSSLSRAASTSLTASTRDSWPDDGSASHSSSCGEGGSSGAHSSNSEVMMSHAPWGAVLGRRAQHMQVWCVSPKRSRVRSNSERTR